MVDKRNYFILVASSLMILSMAFVSSISPNGAGITAGAPQTAPNDSAGTASAYAGNITGLTINSYTTTQTWQGYFGNVSGVIQLADNTDDVLYNWTLASPEGEIYASTNATINWNNVQCFNFTANATGSSGSAGGTNLAGTNLSVLESRFNVASDDVDGIDETFTLIGSGTHDLFYTSIQQFSEGECRNTRVFGDSGQGESNEFEEVLLYEPTTSSVIFTALLEEANTLGFDNANHDFEMLVLEDGHGTDVSTTTYYFFVELE